MATKKESSSKAKAKTPAPAAVASPKVKQAPATKPPAANARPVPTSVPALAAKTPAPAARAPAAAKAAAPVATKAAPADKTVKAKAPTPAPAARTKAPTPAPAPTAPAVSAAGKAAKGKAPPATPAPAARPAAPAPAATAKAAPKAPPAKPAPKPAPRPRTSAPGTPLTEDELRGMSEDDYMNDEQMEFFRRRLLEMRSEVTAREVDAKERLIEREVFADPADRATAEEEHWIDLRLRERESYLLKKIDEALKRIRDKDYGWCTKTGEAIGIPRLLARPTATVCVEVKGQDEKIETHYRDR